MFSWTTGNFGGNARQSWRGGLRGARRRRHRCPRCTAPRNATHGAVAGGSLGMYYAYIQFAGFTMGKAVSQFSTPWSNYPANNFDGLSAAAARSLV